MHQTKKGNQWHFGMKAHIGVDAQSELVHTLIGTVANVQREENLELPVTWHIAMRPSKRKTLPKTAMGELMEKLEHAKASIRAKVEHPFHVIKNLFMHRKTHYKGMVKNTAQLFSLLGFANLLLARRWIENADSQVAS